MIKGKRTERLGELVREAVCEVLIKDIKDPRLEHLTITGAEVTPDARYAKIFVTMPGNTRAREKVMSALAKASRHIRAEISQLITLKYLPELTFVIDESIDEGRKIEKLLKKIEKKAEKNAAKE